MEGRVLLRGTFCICGLEGRSGVRESNESRVVSEVKVLLGFVESRKSDSCDSSPDVDLVLTSLLHC